MAGLQGMDKVIQIDPEMCSGCGACITNCTIEAIHLSDHCAEIDHDLCTACEACLEACPNGAITAITTPQSHTPTPERITYPIVRDRIRPAVQMPDVVKPAHGIKPLTGAVLAFIESDVAPRLLDILTKLIEHKLTQPVATASSLSNPRNYSQRRGLRNQIRHHGRKMANR